MDLNEREYTEPQRVFCVSYMQDLPFVIGMRMSNCSHNEMSKLCGGSFLGTFVKIKR